MLVGVQRARNSRKGLRGFHGHDVTPFGEIQNRETRLSVWLFAAGRQRHIQSNPTAAPK